MGVSLDDKWIDTCAPQLEQTQIGISTFYFTFTPLCKMPTKRYRTNIKSNFAKMPWTYCWKVNILESKQGSSKNLNILSFKRVILIFDLKTSNLVPDAQPNISQHCLWSRYVIHAQFSNHRRSICLKAGLNTKVPEVPDHQVPQVFSGLLLSFTPASAQSLLSFCQSQSKNIIQQQKLQLITNTGRPLEKVIFQIFGF